MQKYIVCVIILILLVVIASASPNATTFLTMLMPYKATLMGAKWDAKWWDKPSFGSPAYSYWETYETFQNPQKMKVDATNTPEDSALLAYPPNTPSPIGKQNESFHLLQDVMAAPRLKESLSCVTSRSCYATDFQRSIEKTGNFRQLTNNYKRSGPDSCSAPFQELVLNFYKNE